MFECGVCKWATVSSTGFFFNCLVIDGYNASAVLSRHNKVGFKEEQASLSRAGNDMAMIYRISHMAHGSCYHFLQLELGVGASCSRQCVHVKNPEKLTRRVYAMMIRSSQDFFRWLSNGNRQQQGLLVP